MAPATHSASDLLISLPDLALLTRVQRPVVSMWRNRPSRTGELFPAPVTKVDGQDLFDATETVDWLEAAGRGNNLQARDDLAAFATLRLAPLREAGVFAGVTALLSLIAIVGPLPDDVDELLDLADEMDPDDNLFYGEIFSLGDRLAGLARYASMLANAAYSPAAALEKLLAERFRLQIDDLAQTDVRSSARDLVVKVARALATDAEFDPVIFIDPTPAGSDVLVDLARRVSAEQGSVEISTPSGSEPSARLMRRRLRAQDIAWRELEGDGTGDCVFPKGSVVVVQLPSLSNPTMSDREVLASLDRIALGCSAGQRVVVLGPASALIDRSRDEEVTRLRRDVLKTDLVRAVIRLPAGLATSQGRRRLALWCLGPPPASNRANEVVRRVTLTADVASGPIAPETIDALVADVLAGMRGPLGAAAHAFRLCRRVATSALQLDEGDLVTPGSPAGGPKSGVEAIETLRSLGVQLGEAVEPYAPPLITPRSDRPQPRRVTVDEAISRRHLTVLPGVRLDPAHLGVATGLSVITAASVQDHGRSPRTTINQLVLAARYPISRLTEPGDVIFCTAPRPAAWVDREGGSVVAFPARVLRCVDPMLLPDLVAADIRELTPGEKAWRAWSLRCVPADHRQPLAVQTAAIDRHRTDLLDRLDALEEFETTMLSAIAGGLLDLTATHSTHDSEGRF